MRRRKEQTQTLILSFLFSVLVLKRARSECEPVGERTSYLWLVRNLICRIFSSNEGDLSHSVRPTFPGKSWAVKARQTFSFPELSSRTDGFSLRFLPCSRMTTPWGEPSNSCAFESTLLDQRFQVEYELDEFILLRHSAISFLFNFLGDQHLSLLNYRTSNYRQHAKCLFITF